MRHSPGEGSGNCSDSFTEERDVETWLDLMVNDNDIGDDAKGALVGDQALLEELSLPGKPCGESARRTEWKTYSEQRELQSVSFTQSSDIVLRNPARHQVSTCVRSSRECCEM